jgi:Arylsulfotransferase (ASST)
LRRVLAVLVLAAALAAAAAWGAFVQSKHVFPYRIARSIYRAAVSERGGPHRWHLARGRPNDPISPETINRLANLPYLRGYRPATTAGVMIHDAAAVQPGLNLFTSGHAPVAALMDMNGRVVKTWKADPRKAFPGLALSGTRKEYAGYLRCATLLPDGGLLAMFNELGLVRLDAGSRLLWSFSAATHHDFVLDPAGTVWTLTRELNFVPGVRQRDPVWEDFVLELSSERRVVRKVSILKALQHSAFAPLLAHLPTAEDIFHTNSLQVFDGGLAARWPLLRRGNILLSIHGLDTVAILDPDLGRIVWALTGQWRAQHSAGLLATGRLLLFDNLGTMRRASRVLEVDPFTQEVLWRFGGVGGQDLLSETNGMVQRLPNGNTLIDESNFGRALEVTPDHRVVWEFVNPNRTGEKNELVATLYFLRRLTGQLSFPDGAAAAQPSAPSASTQ